MSYKVYQANGNESSELNAPFLVGVGFKSDDSQYNRQRKVASYHPKRGITCKQSKGAISGQG